MRANRARPQRSPAHVVTKIVGVFSKLEAMATLTAFLVVIGIGALYIQRDTEKRQLRAYVFVKPLRVTNFLLGTIPEASYAIHNAGQTPAYHMRITSEVYPSFYPKPTNDQIPAGSPEYSPEYILNPSEDNAGVNKKMTRPLVEPEILAIRDGKNMRLYVYGRIIYDDAFENEHYTNYCFAFFGAGPTLTDWNSCTQNNEAN